MNKIIMEIVKHPVKCKLLLEFLKCEQTTAKHFSFKAVIKVLSFSLHTPNRESVIFSADCHSRSVVSENPFTKRDFQTF